MKQLALDLDPPRPWLHVTFRSRERRDERTGELFGWRWIIDTKNADEVIAQALARWPDVDVTERTIVLEETESDP